MQWLCVTLSDTIIRGKTVGMKPDSGRFEASNVSMPTVLVDGPYRFHFFSSDGGEPPHVHVRRDKQVAKVWLVPISVARNQGFAGHELNHIEVLVSAHRDALMEAWHDYFGA